METDLPLLALLRVLVLMLMLLLLLLLLLCARKRQGDETVGEGGVWFFYSSTFTVVVAEGTFNFSKEKR